MSRPFVTWVGWVGFLFLGCQSAPATQPPSAANEPAATVQVPEPEPEPVNEPAAAPTERTTAPGTKRTTASGLGIEELKPGSGSVAQPGHEVSVHYTGTLTDGTVFDSSRQRNTPFKFGLGKGHVIKGFEEGVTGMHVGEVRRLTIPPELGYGAGGAGGKIPPNSTLVFEIELLEVR
jgi:FKBP-type peptidyl-prolyl cis-trans isomerase